MAVAEGERAELGGDDGVCVGENDGTDGDGLAVEADDVNVAVGRGRVPVGDVLGLRVGLFEGEGVAVGTTVRVGVELGTRVGEGLNRAGDLVGVAVGEWVGSNGPGPTRSRICTNGPKLPARSRATAVTNVSPSEKINCRVTCRQNCTCVAS